MSESAQLFSHPALISLSSGLPVELPAGTTAAAALAPKTINPVRHGTRTRPA
jgi:hypothetical protein